MFAQIKDSYKGVFDIFSRYWEAYGSLRAMLLSPYFHVAVVVTLVLTPYWIQYPWWELPIGVLPNIVGFALGGYAILVGFGGENFLKCISQKSPEDGEDHSPFVGVSAAFVHFIIVQLLAILFAVFAKASQVQISQAPILEGLLRMFHLDQANLIGKISPIFYCLGFFLFIYALMTAVAATFSIFRVTTWFEYMSNTKKLDDESN